MGANDRRFRSKGVGGNGFPPYKTQINDEGAPDPKSGSTLVLYMPDAERADRTHPRHFSGHPCVL
jgi:hypothetical protein